MILIIFYDFVSISILFPLPIHSNLEFEFRISDYIREFSNLISLFLLIPIISFIHTFFLSPSRREIIKLDSIR